MIQEAFDLLTELEETSGSNAKKVVLIKGSGNGVFKSLLYYAYNPFMKYNITKWGEVSTICDQYVSVWNYEKFQTLLDDLNKRLVTGNAAIEAVNSFFCSLTEEEYKWYSRTLLKDLRVGVTESTINKVWKNHIPVFDCMLAKPAHKVKKKAEVVYIEPKLDGYRAVCFVRNDGSVEILTRNGKPILGFADVERELALLPWGMVYDGELVGKDNAFNDMQKLALKKDDFDKKAYLNIFDTLPIEEFDAGASTKKLSERKEDLFAAFDCVKCDAPNLKIVEISGPMRYDSPKVDELYVYYLNEGYEGIMIKDIHSLYHCKRTNDWLKVKPVDTFDLEVIGYEEGEGKYVGMLGALIVDFKGHKVNVGSGYSDVQREEFWAIREAIVGRTAEIEAQESTENQKGGESLRFPIFKQFRYDK
ncbi:DNA ligase (ATP) activity protein [Lysinibacillus phage vB_LfM_LysYB1]|nr:DNA ligase (ATP) activity protein [Lysinibacillus phage vB_LfM_LysYB1]WAB25187.1 DNA ligase (ATP) activity protein [Lysinibacillus phage vB_LfM_LysYB2]